MECICLSVLSLCKADKDMPQLSWKISFREEHPTSMRCERFSGSPNIKQMTSAFQIFELEGQLDSALDMQDQDALPQGQARTGSMRRARASMGSNTHPRIPSQSSRKPDSSPGPQARHHVTTALTRPAETTVQASPLAQLFQPLIVDEVIPENGQPNPGTREGVSYGPLSRRRLSSATTLQRMLVPGRESDSSGLMQSPEQRSASLEPETAEETEEKESTVGNLELSRRLDSVEKTQKRIEDLLIEVVSRMRVGGVESQESVTL
jgi:hypothetical protein